MISRRTLVTRSVGGAAVLGALGPVRIAFGAPGAKAAPALLVVFLRGGADGLSLVPPLGGDDRRIYEAERPQLRVPATGDGAVLKLDDRLGLHPAAKDLYKLYQAKRLAIVHAVGLDEATRSHFDAQAIMELGLNGQKFGASGWLARAVMAARGKSPGGEAVTVGQMPPAMLFGLSDALALSGPGLSLGGPGKQQPFQRMALRALYERQGDGDWLAGLGNAALDALDRLEGLAPKDYQPAGGAVYPGGEIGNHLKTVAQLLKMPLGVSAVTVDIGAWDTHKFQGNGAEGQLADKFGMLSSALAALLADMDGRLTVMVMSEFGRRLRENANRGTDHGHGNVMLIAGDGVRGGKVYGTWPGLATERLYDRADLAVTTDYRTVAAEVLGKTLGAPAAAAAFPGAPGKPLGLMTYSV